MALAALMLVVLGAGRPAMARDFTVALPGGDIARAQSQAFLNPYRSYTRQTVRRIDPPAGYDALQAALESEPAPFDLVELRGVALERACRAGLLVDLDWQRLAPPEELLEPAGHRCGAGVLVHADVLAGTRKTFSGAEAPEGWAALWDLETYPGKRTLPDRPRGVMEVALLADGVAADEVYERLATAEGARRALRKLEAIRAHLIFHDTPGEAVARLTAGEAVLALADNGRIDAANRYGGQALRIAWGTPLWGVASWAIPKTSQHPADARRLISFAIQPEPQLRLPSLVAYGSTHSDAIRQLKPWVRRWTPVHEPHMAAALYQDPEFWVEEGARLEDLFSRWRAGDFDPGPGPGGTRSEGPGAQPETTEMPDSAVEDSAVEDTGVEGTGAQETGADGAAVNDAGAEDADE